MGAAATHACEHRWLVHSSTVAGVQQLPICAANGSKERQRELVAEDLDEVQLLPLLLPEPPKVQWLRAGLRKAEGTRPV